MEIIITSGRYSWEAEIFDTPTGRMLKNLLEVKAIQGRCNRWGEEIYFSIPIKTTAEPEASDVVSKGDLGFWPPGSAFCIFFGPTPASREGEVRAASPVNVFGRIKGDLCELTLVSDGDKITVAKK